MDASIGTSSGPSLGCGAVVGRVSVPKAFPGLRSSAAIPGTVLTFYDPYQTYSGLESILAFYGWDFTVPASSVHASSFLSTHVSEHSFPTAIIPSVQVFGPALFEQESGI
jgi:hypothetical protein